MKVIYLNCRQRREYGSDLGSNEHYLSRKKFRPVRDICSLYVYVYVCMYGCMGVYMYVYTYDFHIFTVI